MWSSDTLDLKLTEGRGGEGSTYGDLRGDHLDILVAQGRPPGVGAGRLVEGGDSVWDRRPHHLLHAGGRPALTPWLQLLWCRTGRGVIVPLD